MVRIINNNLWSPVPWGWGCNGCNGGNNWLNNLFGYQMMFGMMNNMFTNLFAPQQRQQTQQTYNPYYGSIYPGLSLGSTQGNTNSTYEEYLEKMQAQNDLTQLKQTWNEFKFSNIGGKYQAVLKADKTVILDGDTPDELMSNIIGYVNENPTQFKTKEKAETGTDGAGGVEAPSNTDSTGDTEETDDTEAEESTGAGDGGAEHRKVKQGWYIASNAANINFKNATTYNALSAKPDKAADKATNALIKAWGNFGKKVDKTKLKATLIKHNPSIFDKNGKLIDGADMTKFDVPTTDWARNNGLCKTCGKQNVTTRAKGVSLKPGSKCVYEFFDDKGNSITEMQYAQKYPKEYLKKVAFLKNKFWNLDTLTYALKLYDEYVGGRSQNDLGITKNKFKEFKHSIVNGKHQLWCDYVGYRTGPNGGIYANTTYTYDKPYCVVSLANLYDKTNNLRNPNDRKYTTAQELQEQLNKAG